MHIYHYLWWLAELSWTRPNQLLPTKRQPLTSLMKFGMMVWYDCSCQRSLSEWGKTGNRYVKLKQKLNYHAHDEESVKAWAQSKQRWHDLCVWRTINRWPDHVCIKFILENRVIKQTNKQVQLGLGQNLCSSQNIICHNTHPLGLDTESDIFRFAVFFKS